MTEVRATSYMNENGQHCCVHLVDGQSEPVGRIQSPLDYMFGIKRLACQKCFGEWQKIEERENAEEPGQLYWRTFTDDEP